MDRICQDEWVPRPWMRSEHKLRHPVWESSTADPRQATQDIQPHLHDQGIEITALHVSSSRTKGQIPHFLNAVNQRCLALHTNSSPWPPPILPPPPPRSNIAMARPNLLHSTRPTLRRGPFSQTQRSRWEATESLSKSTSLREDSLMYMLSAFHKRTVSIRLLY